jgi:hypothetical protein
MNAAVQNGFPLDLLGILGAGEHREGLATAGTLSLLLGEVVNDILRGEVLATFSPVAFGPRLLASFAWWLAVSLGRICSVALVTHGGSRIVWVGLKLGALLGLSAEDLSLEPSHSR